LILPSLLPPHGNLSGKVNYLFLTHGFPETQMKILVVYYSWKGHTETVAAQLAGTLNAELERIESIHEPAIFAMGIKAWLGMKAAVKPCRTDLKDVDFLVIASPVWARKVPPYINEYLSLLQHTEGKPFSVLIEMGGSGADRAIRHIRRILEAKGMRFVSSEYTLEADVEANQVKDRIAAFAETIRPS
jgi:flavodoxin